MPKKEIDNKIFVSCKKDERTGAEKPPMSYVNAVIHQAKNNNEVIIKARGRAISKAVDVSQITINKFLDDWKVGDLTIGTEEKPLAEGSDHPKNVSWIEIVMQKK